MTYELINGNHNQTRVRARKWLYKDPSPEIEGEDPKRERFLAHLKSRHGYNDEKASKELDRLLEQFYKMERISGIQRPRPIIKHL